MIKIICIGKIKESFFKDAILEYKKRISKYNKIEIIELTDFDLDIKSTIRKEGELILKTMKDSDYNILMDINGKEFDSLSLSKKIDEIFLSKNTITFIIGGSYGVDDLVREKCDLKISFSKLTFPHQLFRIILLEQIYRSFKILNNEEYHK